MEKNSTIYNYFEGYTKEQVDAVVARLDEHELMLIKLLFGENLGASVMDDEHESSFTNVFYEILYPKLIALLSDETLNENESNNFQFSENGVAILKFLQSPTFIPFMSMLNTKEAIVLALRLGYASDGKCFSVSHISKALDIQESEVVATIEKIFQLINESKKVQTLNRIR